MLLTVLGASIVSLITGYNIPVYGANYVNFAMFMAFALLYPDTQVLLFFFFPIRMKWLAYIDVFYFFFDIARYIAAGRWYYSIMPIVALLNFVIFFWPELTRFFKLEHHQSRQGHTLPQHRARPAASGAVSAADAGLSPQVRRVRPHRCDESRAPVPLLQQVRGVSLLLL